MYWLGGILAWIALLELIARMPEDFRDHFSMTGFEPAAFGLPPFPQFTGPPDEESVTDQIERIYGIEIPELAELLPSDSWHHESLSQAGDLWTFDFECNFQGGRFSGMAQAQMPLEAFELTKAMILQQLHDWHKMRFVPRPSEMDQAA